MPPENDPANPSDPAAGDPAAGGAPAPGADPSGAAAPPVGAGAPPTGAPAGDPAAGASPAASAPPAPAAPEPIAVPDAAEIRASIEPLDDPALLAKHAALGTEITDGKAALVAKAGAGEAVTRADLEPLKAKQAVQAAIGDLLVERDGERKMIAAGLGDLESMKLPDITAAVGAAVGGAKLTNRQPEADKAATGAGSLEGAEHLAKTAAMRDYESGERPAWKSQREGIGEGGVADIKELFNAGKFTRGSRVEPRRDSVLAAIRAPRDEELELTDSVSHNERAIALAVEAHIEARRELGGGSKLAAICDPATIIRDALSIGTDATPFRSSLVGMTASSGNALKYTFRQPTSMSVASGGIGVFTAADQALVDPEDPETWKPCVRIGCSNYDTVEAVEWTACYEVDAFTELSSPESVRDFVWAKDKAYARFTEAWHLREMDTYLYPFTWAATTLGALPETIAAILSALAQGDYGERLIPGNYLVFGSPGLLYALTADKNKQAFAQRVDSTMEAVQSAVEDATKTSYVQLLDQPLQANGTLGASPFASLGTKGDDTPPVLPTLATINYDLRIIDTSNFVSMSTGEAVFGEQVTLTQAKQNDRGFFQREFGQLLEVGGAPNYKIRIPLKINGVLGGFQSPPLA